MGRIRNSRLSIYKQDRLIAYFYPAPPLEQQQAYVV